METSTARGVGLTDMRSITAPATWGQRMMWHWIQWMAPNTEHFNIVLEMTVPTRTAVDDIVDAVAELTRRHEALRTRFRADGDVGLVQELRSTDELVVETAEVADVASLGELVATLFKDLRATRFAPEQLPLRTVIAVASGKPLAVVLAVSHVAVDMLSARIVRDELAEMLAARVAGRDYPAPRRSRQPVEQAVLEASAKGQRTARRSLDYWRGRFEMAPQALFAVPPAAAPDADRYRRGLLTSRAIGLAAGALARRYGSGTSTVLLAATALVLGRYTGAERCTLRLNAGNRAGPDLRHTVGMLTQDVPVTVELGGPRFADVVATAWSASLHAYRRAQYDWAQVEGVWRDTCLRRGLNLDLSCFFNDLRGNTARPATDVAPETIQAALAETTFAWVESWPRDPRTLMVRLTDQRGPVVLDLTIDTSALPLAQARSLVGSIERLLVEAAGSDADLANMAALADIVPPHRGDEWRNIDGCWIDLAAVRQLLADAVDPVAAEAVVKRGPHGESVLVGYLTPRDPGLTPEAAHAACTALLPGRRTAMAPQRYVLRGQDGDPTAPI